MPETRECRIHGMHMALCFETLLKALSPESLHLKNLWYDMTDAEQEEEIARFNPLTLSRLAKGLVDRLEPDNDRWISPQRMDEDIWPSRGRKPWPHDELHSLVLRGVQFTCRSILLDFGLKWLSVCIISASKCVHWSLTFIFSQIRFLTHTCLQAYSWKEWEESVMPTSKRVNHSFLMSSPSSHSDTSPVVAFSSQRAVRTRWSLGSSLRAM